MNATLRQNGIPCEWRYEMEEETSTTYNDGRQETTTTRHHNFRVYVGQPVHPTQPPPGQAMATTPHPVPVVWQQQLYTTNAPAPVPAGGVAQGIVVGHPYPMYQQHQGQYAPMQGVSVQQQYPTPCQPPAAAPPQQADQCAASQHDAQTSAGMPVTNTVSTLETTSAAPTV